MASDDEQVKSPARLRLGSRTIGAIVAAALGGGVRRRQPAAGGRPLSGGERTSQLDPRHGRLRRAGLCSACSSRALHREERGKRD